ncbi:hypothetical protein SBADM41S_00951 [Streptomyces badius]
MPLPSPASRSASTVSTLTSARSVPSSASSWWTSARRSGRTTGAISAWRTRERRRAASGKAGRVSESGSWISSRDADRHGELHVPALVGPAGCGAAEEPEPVPPWEVGMTMV